MSILTEAFPYGSDPFTMFFMPSLLLGALSLSSLGLFGLYGAVLARSGRPGLLAGTGAVFSTGAAALWLATSVYFPIYMLARGSALFAPFEWLWYTGTFVIPVAMLFWFLGFLLLGIAAFRQPLPVQLRLLPLALRALIVSSYLLGDYLASATLGSSGTATIVMGLAQSLPFVGIALLGWVLLKGYDTEESLAVSGGSVESARATHEMTRSVSRTTSGAWGARSATTSGAKAATQEKELLKAIRRHGEITVAQAALETSLSVEEADRMLSALAARGHLEVRIDDARIIYSFWEGNV
jgi:hypothetical protein